MRFCPALLLASLFLASLFCVPASAADDKTWVYVHIFELDKRVGPDGSGLTGSFCGDLMKDKSLEVVCETDMRQMMDFAALQAMAGTGSNASDPIKRRMGQVEVLVRGTVEKGKHGLILNLEVHERDPAFDGEMLTPAREYGRLRIKGISGGLSGLSQRLPGVAKRVAAMTKTTPQGPAKSPPPEPVEQ